MKKKNKKRVSWLIIRLCILSLCIGMWHTGSIVGAAGLNEWVDSKPYSKYELKLTGTRTVYQYRDKSTTTSTSSTLSGWIRDDSKTTSKTTWSGWSGWSGTKVTASSTKKVETRQVVASYKTQYRYGRWNNASNTWWHFCPVLAKQQRGGEWHLCYTPWLNSPIAGRITNPASRCSCGCYNQSTNGNQREFKYNGQNYYWQDTQQVPASYKTEYRYQTATTTYTYSFYKWSTWSSWSTTKPTASNTRQVQSKLQYQYALDERSSGNWEYLTESGRKNIVLTDYNGSSTSVEIPSSIGENTVTGIQGGVFSGCSQITKVIIPNSVTVIDGAAFSGCDSGVTLVVDEGSAAETFAKNNGYSYQKPGEAEAAKKRIEEQAEEEKQKIDALSELTEEEKEKKKQEINDAVENIKQTIEQASGSGAIGNAENEGKGSLSTITQQAEEENTLLLETAKENAKAELDKNAAESIKIIEGLQGLTAEEKQKRKDAINKAVKEAKERIAAASTGAVVNDEKTKLGNTLEVEKKEAVKEAGKKSKLISLSGCIAQLSAHVFTYTGTEIKPMVTVMWNGNMLKEGVEYTLRYENNINAGSGKVVIEPVAGKSQDSQPLYFEITKSAMPKNKLNKKTINMEYTGKKLSKASIISKLKKKDYLDSDMKLGRDFSLSYKASQTAKKNMIGSVKGIKLKVVFKGNYTGTATVKIRLYPAKVKKLKSTKKSNGIKLTWKKVPGVDGYYIYRGTRKHSEPITDKKLLKKGDKVDKRIGIIKNKGSLAFIDKTAKKGKTYYYYITSYKNKKYTSKSLRIKVKY